MGVKNRLKDIRMKKFGMERADFAKFIGIDIKTYYGLESGRSTPKLQKALGIADILGEKIDDIWYLEK
jgi:DNA-binding XRE family transcriptional regulator